MKKVPTPKVVTTLEAPESALPAEIQEALGELVGAAREGLLALSVGVGLGVVHELMELEVTEVVARRGSTTRSGRRSVTATRTGRLRSAARASRCAGRGCARQTMSTSCRSAATSTWSRTRPAR